MIKYILKGLCGKTLRKSIPLKTYTLGLNLRVFAIPCKCSGIVCVDLLIRLTVCFHWCFNVYVIQFNFQFNLIFFHFFDKKLAKRAKYFCSKVEGGKHLVTCSHERLTRHDAVTHCCLLFSSKQGGHCVWLREILFLSFIRILVIYFANMVYK